MPSKANKESDEEPYHLQVHLVSEAVKSVEIQTGSIAMMVYR